MGTYFYHSILKNALAESNIMEIETILTKGQPITLTPEFIQVEIRSSSSSSTSTSITDSGGDYITQLVFAAAEFEVPQFKFLKAVVLEDPLRFTTVTEQNVKKKYMKRKRGR